MIQHLNVLILCEDKELAQRFSTMLKPFPKVESVQISYCIEDTKELTLSYPINVVILSSSIGKSGCVDILMRFKSRWPDLPVIITASHDKEGLSYECFSSGANDYLIESEITPNLLYRSCLHTVEKDIIFRQNQFTEATLKSILNIAPIGIGMAIERKMQWVNSYMYELTGFSREELEGQSSRMLYKSVAEFERVGSIKYPAVYEGEREITETQWLTKDGNKLDILLGASAICPGSPSAGIIFTALDITKIKNARRRIQEERDKAQRFLDIAGTIILVLDLKGRIVLINKRGCEILKYESADELIGLDWFDTCILSEQRKEIRRIFREVVNLGGSLENVLTYENLVVCKDGETRLISWKNSYIFDERDLVIICSGEDITERRATEKALVLSEEKYRTAIESAGEGILVVQDEIIHFVNNRIGEIFGYEIDEMIGHSFEEFLHPDYYKMIAAHHRKRMVGEETGNAMYTIRAIRKDGVVLDIDLRVTSMAWENRPAALAFILDVTDRTILKERQDLIINILKLLNGPYSGTETIESLLRKIQDFTGIEAIGLRLQLGEDYPYFVYKGFSKEFIELENSICMLDANDCIIREDTGTPILQCVCGCVIRGNVDHSQPFFTSNGSFWTNATTELIATCDTSCIPYVRNRCNTEGYESVAIIPLSTGPEIIGTLQLNDSRPNMFTKDFINFLEELAVSIAVAVQRTLQEDHITSLKMAKTKDLLESSRLLNAGIAHELRTPMQAILNCLELISFELNNRCISEDDIPDYECPKRRLVNSLVKDGLERTDYSIKVLNSLSEYSKIASSEEIHLINVVLELKTIMRTLLFTDLFKSLDNNSFVLEVEDAEECSISINKIDFSQLLTNLCTNAMEAIQHKDPKIVVRVSEHNDKIEIRVIDNGKGIDFALGNKIFEPYFSTKEVPGGRNQGLGLAMVRDIVAAYGGEIDYISRPGHTEFIVEFDCERGE